MIIDNDSQAVAVATAYVQAWSDKVPAGAKMTIAKMKCALADGPCGCAPDSTNWKCAGPYPQVPIEILIDVLQKGAIEGVQIELLPAAKAIIIDKHVHYVEFAAPFDVIYVQKV